MSLQFNATASLKASLQSDIKAINSISVIPALLDLVCSTTGMGFAVIARVTDKTWVACSVLDNISFGLHVGDELLLETTICNEIRQLEEPVVINNVDLDEHYSKHHTPAMYGFKSYISVPIIKRDGSFFGTLCAIDPKPAIIDTPQIRGMFKMYADLISFHLHSMERLEMSEGKLLLEKENAKLKDQFMAILGHDLRSPLSAIANAADLLILLSKDDATKKLSNIVKNSSFRMSALIENILDFAKGQLGQGITVNLKETIAIQEILEEVIAEMKSVWPQRVIYENFNFLAPVKLDGNRIAQLFSNLLGNALSYGKAEAPVVIKSSSNPALFTLSVTNECEKIPATKMAQLFRPFYRGEEAKQPEGLGLGLYIASEIAAAHNGTLDVTSDEEKTCFTLSIPL